MVTTARNQSQDREDGRLLTPDDLARRWQMHKGSLANLRSDGEGPAYVKIGRNVRYRLADVLAYEQAQSVTTAVAA